MHIQLYMNIRNILTAGIYLITTPTYCKEMSAVHIYH